MIRSKRIAHRPAERTSLKDDLEALRNSIQLTQQTVSRLESRLDGLKATTASRRSRTNNNERSKRPASIAPNNVSKQRQLLQDIVNRDRPNRPCWYHRMHGSAALECIASCSFVRLNPVLPSKMKKTTKPLIGPRSTPTEDVIEAIDQANLESADTIIEFVAGVLRV